MPFLQADGLAELLDRLGELRVVLGARRSIRSASASATTLSFSWIASWLRRPAFSSSTRRSSERIADPVCSASSHFVALDQNG